MPRLHDSIYCYYHDKVCEGLLEPAAVGLGLADHVEYPGASYPAWPLPKMAYRLETTILAEAS